MESPSGSELHGTGYVRTRGGTTCHNEIPSFMGVSVLIGINLCSSIMRPLLHKSGCAHVLLIA